MAIDITISHYSDGTATVAGVNVTGQGTAWSKLRKGDLYGTHLGFAVRIAEVIDDTHLTLAHDVPALYQIEAAYEIQRTPYDLGYLQGIQDLLEKLGNGNLESFAGLAGLADKLPMFTGPGELALVSKIDLVSGVKFNVQVDDLAARAAYDNEASGFAVLVANVGDGRSAIYAKRSGAAADWSDPAYLTGEVGPEADVTVGPTTTLPPGSPATVTPTPTPGGVQLDFGIPAGEGFYWEGSYNPANAYDKDSVVRQNGSTFIAAQAVPPAQAPSSSYPPVDTTYWKVLAAKGQDGTGTGDMVGPASATAKRLAVFGNTTGKILAEASGLTLSEQGRARADLGLNVLSDERDKIINGRFEVAQRTLPVAIAVSGVGIDCWRVACLSGITALANRVALPAGDVRGKYFMQVAFSGAGASGSFVSQRMPGVETHAGRRATLAFSAADSHATAGVVQVRQFFGTGGSPSAPVAVNTPITLGTTLSPFQLLIDVPSIAGKTLGTNGDDYLEVIFIPTVANTHTFSLSNVRFDEGDATLETNLPVKSLQRQEELCKWFYEVREIGANGVAAVAQAYTTTSCAWELQYQPKRANPSISVPTNLVPLSATGATQTVNSHTPTAIGRDCARVTTAIAAAALVAGNAAAILSSAGARIVIDAEYA